MINQKTKLLILKFQIINNPEYQVADRLKYQVNKFNFLTNPI